MSKYEWIDVCVDEDDRLVTPGESCGSSYIVTGGYKQSSGVEEVAEIRSSLNTSRNSEGGNSQIPFSVDALILGAGGIGQNVGFVLGHVANARWKSWNNTDNNTDNDTNLGVDDNVNDNDYVPGLQRDDIFIRTITFLDCDVYEPSNINRQLLGKASDFGKKKAEVAAVNLCNAEDSQDCMELIGEFEVASEVIDGGGDASSSSGSEFGSNRPSSGGISTGSRFNDSTTRTKVSWIHIDACKEWQTVAKLASNHSVIFNCIDEGLVWDYCCQSLAKSLRIPLVQGQSFGWK
jgi:hypothetical protein